MRKKLARRHGLCEALLPNSKALRLHDILHMLTTDIRPAPPVPQHFRFNTRCCWQQQNTFLQPVLLRAKAEYFASTRAVSSTCVAAGQSRILLLQHALLLAIVKTGARCIMSEAGSAISSPSTGRRWRRLEASLGGGLGSLIGGVFSLPWLNTGCLLLFVKQGTSL